MATAIDCTLFLLVGWVPFVSPCFSYRRYIKLIRFGRVENYRKYILAYALLAVGEWLEIVCLLLSMMLVMNAKTAKIFLKKERELTKTANAINPQG